MDMGGLLFMPYEELSAMQHRLELDGRERLVVSGVEEVERFVSRALLLRRGKLVGDASTLDLEERGGSLTAYVKETYGYEPDRVSRALDRLTEGEEEP